MMEPDQAVKAMEDFAASLFEQLREATHDGVGITRASYGKGEQLAHTVLAERARALGFEVTTDAAGNTFMTLPGADRDAPPMIIGSHLDSVAQGGNFDGAAGVVSGLVAILALRDTGVVPVRDIRVMGIRAEEGEWFGECFVGSRSALGTLPEGALERARRVDSGLALHEHIAQAGCCDLNALRAGHVSLPPGRVHGFIEVHIEQGPVLDEAGIPVGLVTGIRGNARLPEARCKGEYSHCGLPRTHRRDAVVAVAELVCSLDGIWIECEAAGKDFAFTVGKFFTDARLHTLSKIAGAVDFTLDMRSVDNELLDEMEARVAGLAADIGARRGVNFELGSFTRGECGVLDPRVMKELREGIDTLGVRAMDLVSGASHDAAVFATAGVPTAMLFIRNANGSHNPHEAMALRDFTEATRVLTWWLAHRL